ncbi:MAG: hypothetical protein FWB86_08125 [Treponema sp.]|nr:hypothetical protein [Treponema sp.]MCL2251950.1 hypothetical protein [Treponema sp.]
MPTNAIVKINVINHTYSNPKLPVTVWIGEDKSTAKTIAWGHDVEFSVPIPDGETQVVLYAERSDHSGNPTKYTHTFTYASIMDTAMLRYFKDGSDLPFLGKR